jgi:hypothetical protein
VWAGAVILLRIAVLVFVADLDSDLGFDRVGRSRLRKIYVHNFCFFLFTTERQSFDAGAVSHAGRGKIRATFVHKRAARKPLEIRELEPQKWEFS